MDIHIYPTAVMWPLIIIVDKCGSIQTGKVDARTPPAISWLRQHSRTAGLEARTSPPAHLI